MRLTPKRLQELRLILKDEFNLNYSDEELQIIGLAVVRFVMAKYKKSQGD